MKLIYLFFFLILFSCMSNKSDRNENIVYEWDDKEQKLVVLDSIKIDTIIDYIMQIHQIDSFFFVEYPNDWAVFVQQGNKLVFDSFLVRKGSGPFETLASTRFSRLNDGRLFLGECIGSEKVMLSPRGNIKDIVKISLWDVDRRQGANPFYFESLQPVNADIVIGGIQGESTTKFVSYDFKTDKYWNLNYDYPNLYNELSDFEKSFATEGILMKKPNDNIYLFSTTIGLYSLVFNCDGYDIYNEKIIYKAPARYKSHGKRGQRPKLLDVQARYNAFPYVTNDYIYMSDREVTVDDVFGKDNFEELPYMYTTEIVAFNWSGEPCRKYTLESPIRSFFVNEKNSTLCGIGIDNDGVDYILKYQME